MPPAHPLPPAAGSPQKQRQGAAGDAVTAALRRCHDMFVEGAPDDAGQMTPAGFCSIFGLKVDEYTDRLVKIFDLDNSNAIGFREFLYGLSKFQVGPGRYCSPQDAILELKELRVQHALDDVAWQILLSTSLDANSTQERGFSMACVG